jgi:hypothetical protein
MPAIMLGDAAIGLIEDVFDRRGMFDGFHRIRKRVVAWGPIGEPVAVEHSAVVVSEQQLLECVRGEEARGDGEGDWTVITARPLPDGVDEKHFGTRKARAIPVRVAGDAHSCWIESLDEGWLFLIPKSEVGGWLLAVGASPETLLARSRLIAGQVVEAVGEESQFPAYPRIVSPLCGERWIACGSAAMAFDPVCGDGTANAVREAILASAVISEGCGALDHYEARLIAAFQKHLSLCANYYRTGQDQEWWHREAALLQDGLIWCAQRLSQFGEYRYRLKGFELVRMLP